MEWRPSRTSWSSSLGYSGSFSRSYAGNVDKRFYMDNLQLEASEFELIAHPQNGVCLFKCGNERYLLEVHAPDHIRALFGEAGGR